MGVTYSDRRDPEPGLLVDFGARTADLDAENRADAHDIEITDVQTTVVDGNYDWTLVRVYTNAGVAGTGEAYWGAGVPATIDAMKPYLIGENPLDVDRLFQHMTQRMSGEGSLAGMTVTAISGVEIALHDLAGKLLGVPAYQLLGGKYRDDVRVYCDTHAGAHGAESDTGSHSSVYDPDQYARAAEDVVGDGFDALKFDLDVPSGHDADRMNRHLSGPDLQHKVDIVDAVMDAVGDRAAVAFDCHWSWSAETAIRLARRLEQYDVLALEDPVPPENPEVKKRVTDSTITPILSGENVYRKHGFRPLIEDQALDIVHPDMPKAGGMREVRKIADMAESYDMPFAMHNVSSPVGTMAAAHVATAVPNFLALEYHARSVPWWEDLVAEPVIEDGYITVPQEPGLGITLDRDVIQDHVADGETLFDLPDERTSPAT